MTNSAPSCEIVVAKFRASELDIKFTAPADNFDPKTARSIYNAWMETAIIDNYGAVWISPDRMSEILRTSKGCARHIIGKIRDEHKKNGAGGIYLRYSEINRILSNTIISAGSIKKEQYAEYSESIGIDIRNSVTARFYRAKFYDSIKDAKRKLKAARVKTLSISQDELTRIPLLKSSHFSHIRSCAVYPSLATSLWNGLIVNCNTHKIITDSHVNDEDELLELCQENNWNQRWYQEFKVDLATFN